MSVGSLLSTLKNLESYWYWIVVLLIAIIILKLIQYCQSHNTSSIKNENSQNESQTQNPEDSNPEIEDIKITSTIASKIHQQHPFNHFKSNSPLHSY